MPVLCNTRKSNELLSLSLSLSQQATHPVYNITPEKVARAVMHFLQQPVPSLEPAAAAN